MSKNIDCPQENSDLFGYKSVSDKPVGVDDNHRHCKPDCKLCMAMWKNGYEQAKKDLQNSVERGCANK